MRRFQELLVWQKAHQLVLDVYRTTKRFPRVEQYALIDQMRRAAVSIPANIVEGHKRTSKREFMNFVSIAEGSLEESKCYALLSRDLGDLSADMAHILTQEAEEVGRMLHGLKSHIKEELIHANGKQRALVL